MSLNWHPPNVQAVIKVLAVAAITLLAVGTQALSLLDAVESSLRDDGFYIEEGVDATAAEMGALVGAYPGFYFVALADEVPDGNEALADDLLDRLGSGTVVVFTPEEAGAVSSEFDDADMADAFDNTQFGGSYVEDFRAFAAELAGGSEPVTHEENTGGVSLVPIVIGVALVGLVGLALWRGSRKGKAANEHLLAEAQTEIREQMDVVAGQIVELADDPRVAAKPEAQDHYRQASVTFQEAEGRLAAATSLPALEDLSDDLDRARWQLDATEALVQGKPLPP
ncbi:hypothetical protein BH18ACT5_BH18ACT5_03910 [soil metagenome]